MPSRSLAVISICLATAAAFNFELSATPILSSAASPRATQLHLRATTAAQSAAAKKRAQSSTTKSQFSSKRRQRVPVPPPKPDAPTPRETLPKWATIQVTSDFISLCVLSLLTKISIPDLFLEGNSNLLWFLGGPALSTRTRTPRAASNRMERHGSCACRHHQATHIADDRLASSRPCPLCWQSPLAAFGSALPRARRSRTLSPTSL